MRAVIALLFALATPVLAEEPSLSGTYSGSVVCDRTENGRPGTFQLALDLRIRQDGERLDLATWSEAEVAAGTRVASLYTGKAAIADGSVSGYVMACKPDFAYDEIVRILPALPEGDTFTFAAETIFITEMLPGREGDLILESCRWAMVRTGTDVPDFEACPNG